MDGRKIYLNDWLKELIKNINYNIEKNKECYELKFDDDYLKCVSRDEKLLEKMDKYKKTDEKGNVYFYFFPNELETILWIFLENSILRGGLE